MKERIFNVVRDLVPGGRTRQELRRAQEISEEAVSIVRGLTIEDDDVRRKLLKYDWIDGKFEALIEVPFQHFSSVYSELNSENKISKYSTQGLGKGQLSSNDIVDGIIKTKLGTTIITRAKSAKLEALPQIYSKERERMEPPK